MNLLGIAAHEQIFVIIPNFLIAQDNLGRIVLLGHQKDVVLCQQKSLRLKFVRE